MNPNPARIPLSPGAPAPDFRLPAVHRDGTVTLAEYKGRAPLLLTIFRGLYCPFCRRALAQLSAMNDSLRAAGADLLAVVATDPDKARLYFRLRPATMSLAADPECTTHAAYGVPAPQIDAQAMRELASIRINPTGELAQPVALFEAGAALNALDGYALDATDQRDMQRQGSQFTGQFLLDREGVVRWVNIECARDGIAAGFGRIPTEDELLRVVATLH